MTNTTARLVIPTTDPRILAVASRDGAVCACGELAIIRFLVDVPPFEAFTCEEHVSENHKKLAARLP